MHDLGIALPALAPAPWWSSRSPGPPPRRASADGRALPSSRVLCAGGRSGANHLRVRRSASSTPPLPRARWGASGKPSPAAASILNPLSMRGGGVLKQVDLLQHQEPP